MGGELMSLSDLALCIILSVVSGLCAAAAVIAFTVQHSGYCVFFAANTLWCCCGVFCFNRDQPPRITLNLAEAAIVDVALEHEYWNDVEWGDPIDPALTELRDQVAEWMKENS
jgi:hypothetical protein